MTGVREYLQRREGAHLEELFEFLGIASVSALSQHRADMRRAADWLADRLRRVGLDGVRIMETGGHPAVYGEWLGKPGAPTALIYGHYDVQPVDPLNLWTSPPFEPAVRDGKIFARGAADDKGQVMIHLHALEALLASEGELPVNVKVLIEGEEEVGSPNLEPFIQTHRELLQADLVVISDTTMAADGIPTICYGLRGIAEVEVHVRTAATDLHSGLYGGAAPNALHVLVELLASLRDGQGRIALPGFYDDVEPLTPVEREAARALPFDGEALKEELGVGEFAGEEEYTPLERMTARPTLELNGVWGGFQGEGSKTVIPAEAHAKITCRLVPRQDPGRIQRLLKEYLESRAGKYATVTVDLKQGSQAWATRPDSPEIEAAAAALEATFGKKAALARSGGSIPVVQSFDAVFGVPCVLIGFASPGCNAHAPDEHLSLDTFRLGREAIAGYWKELAQRMSA